MTAITGECFCGALRYRIEGPLGPGRCCHCSRCRKAFGGAGSAVASVAPEVFRWLGGTERLVTYGGAQRGPALCFCATCGSTLCVLLDGAVVQVALGTLNGEPPVSIAQHLFVGSKACWDEIGGQAPRFEAWPPDPAG